MNKCASNSCGCSDTPVVTPPGPVTPQQQTVYRTENMDCPTEEALIRRRLGRLAGIDGLDFNLMQRTPTVSHTLPSLEPLEAAQAGIGMNVRQTNDDTYPRDDWHRRGRAMRQLIAFFCLGAVLVLALLPPAVQAEPAPARRAELLRLVVQDCGSCHGLRMEGGLGLPLTPKALEGKDRDGLALTIMQGRYGTTMPPWSAFVTTEEAGWIVDMLKRGLLDAR